MNERIKEFIDKANGYWEHGDFNMPKTVCFSEHDIELFAELIVRECIGTVEGISPGYEDYRNQIEDAFRRDCVAELKHKFGVEE